MLTPTNCRSQPSNTQREKIRDQSLLRGAFVNSIIIDKITRRIHYGTTATGGIKTLENKRYVKL